MYGSEFNHEQVVLARAAGVGVIDDFNAASTPKMDVIFCEQVLGHTVHPREIMSNLAAISRKGTILHLGVPDSFMTLSASDSFKDKTTQVNELRQTDFIYFFIINHGWYYLSTISDDYSRCIDISNQFHQLLLS